MGFNHKVNVYNNNHSSMIIHLANHATGRQTMLGILGLLK